MRAIMRLSDHRVLIGTVNCERLKGGGVGIVELIKFPFNVRPANWAEI